MHRKVAWALVLSLAAAVVGCGGGSGRGGLEQGATQSSASLVSRADQICARLARKSIAVSNEVSSAGSQNQQAQQGAIVKLGAIRRQELDELDALKGPSALQARLHSFVVAQRHQISVAIAEAKQSVGQPPSAELASASAKSSQLARAIGFKRCP